MMFKVKVINEGTIVEPLVVQQLLNELLFNSIIVDIQFNYDDIMFVEMIVDEIEWIVDRFRVRINSNIYPIYISLRNVSESGSRIIK